ncbi:CobD/CbiB family cobalamin biosynthesis protein [Actinospongicola halichondriae]|uniref:CobD/CbiB family cobalamin biosynthesis protein n=1 Tax=Actinospongicola halichondriae TaxID=3236844 RepID=UPI003D52A215
MSLTTRAAATALGLVASRQIPRLSDEVHPVARFGSTMTTIESQLWRDDRGAGVVYALAGAAIAAATGRASHSTTATVAICASGAQLRSTGAEIARLLEEHDTSGARAALPALVGRDPSTLDDSGIAAAVIESLAENSVDAVFGPAFWGLVAGAPGAAVHRALDTMDSMVGRRNLRYENFGWAAARADDISNLVPARVFALAVAATVPHRRDQVLAAVRRDAGAHPSPNAGVAEAAMAGALGVELGGPLRYGDDVEDRPTLGIGPRPTALDVRRAIDIARRTEDLLIALLAGIAVVSFVRRRR